MVFTAQWLRCHIKPLSFTGRALISCFFFFQAEDGIRDGRVTGVQTCALPISYRTNAVELAREHDGVGPVRLRDQPDERGVDLLDVPAEGLLERAGQVLVPVERERSEERRVGKEGRSRWGPYH